MDSMKDILSKAFQIGNDAKFLVGILENGQYIENEMTYLQLGLFLTQGANRISKVKIIMRGLD